MFFKSKKTEEIKKKTDEINELRYMRDKAFEQRDQWHELHDSKLTEVIRLLKVVDELTRQNDILFSLNDILTSTLTKTLNLSGTLTSTLTSTQLTQLVKRA